jgi:hypothetical protein
MTHRPYTSQFITQCLAQANEEGKTMQANVVKQIRASYVGTLEALKADMLGDAGTIKAEREANDTLAVCNALALERAVRYIEGAIGYLK